MDKMPKEHRALTMKDITALMVTDITQYKRGYLTVDELNSQYFFAKEYRFEDRKYNQIAHLASHLEHFVDLKFDSQKGEFWFENDLQIKDLDPDKTFKRDMICHRFFKEELKIESGRIYGRPVCYVEEVQHKTLVASHIKPCIDCLRQQKEDEAYDVNNGLLLSPTMDSYFDKKDITFSDEGEIIIGGGVPDDFAIKLKGFKLNSALMTPERKCYLGYHRTLFEAKNHA